MEAIAHSPGFAKEAGVPQSVGKDFARADDKAGITKTHHGHPVETRGSHMARTKASGETHAEVGRRFGVSKSTAHRTISKHLAKGYKPMGRAD